MQILRQGIILTVHIQNTRDQPGRDRGVIRELAIERSLEIYENKKYSKK